MLQLCPAFLHHLVYGNASRDPVLLGVDQADMDNKQKSQVHSHIMLMHCC